MLLPDFTKTPITKDIGGDQESTLTCQLGETSYPGTWSWFKGGVKVVGTEKNILADQDNQLTIAVQFLIRFIILLIFAICLLHSPFKALITNFQNPVYLLIIKELSRSNSDYFLLSSLVIALSWTVVLTLLECIPARLCLSNKTHLLEEP